MMVLCGDFTNIYLKSYSVDRYWSLSQPLSYTEDVTNKRILVAYFLSKIIVFLVTALLFLFGFTITSCEGSLVDVVCRLMSANFVYFNAFPAVMSSLAVMFVSKYAWNTHIQLKTRNRVQPLSQTQSQKEREDSITNITTTTTTGNQSTSADPSGTCDIAVIRVVRQNEEPYVFFRRSEG